MCGCTGRSANPKLHEIKFNSTNKWQLSIHRPEGPGATAPLLVLKGAPERVLRMCSHILINGEQVPMTPEWTAKYNAAYESLGAMGERVLGFAYRSLEVTDSFATPQVESTVHMHCFSCSQPPFLPAQGTPMDFAFTNKPQPNFPTDGLVFAGLVSLIDPPREGVPEAVAKCKRARIKVYMVTGDHPITALAIAKSVGIIDQDRWDAGKALVVKGEVATPALQGRTATRSRVAAPCAPQSTDSQTRPLAICSHSNMNAPNPPQATTSASGRRLRIPWPSRPSGTGPSTTSRLCLRACRPRTSC